MTKKLSKLLILLIVSLLVVALTGCTKNKKKTPGKDSEANIYEITIKYEDGTSDLKIKRKSGAKFTFDEKNKDVNKDDKSNLVYLPQKSKTGYDFKGWRITGKSTLTLLKEGDEVKENMTVSPKFESQKFKLTLDVGRGKDLVDIDKEQTIYYGNKDTKISVPKVKSGKETEFTNICDKFLYWYIKDENDKEIQVSDLAKKGANVVSLLGEWKYLNVKENKLHAKWRTEAADITVEFKDKETGNTIIAKKTIKEYDAVTRTDDMFNLPDDKVVHHWYYEKEYTNSNKEKKYTEITYNFKDGNVEGDSLKENVTLYAKYSSVEKIGSEEDYNNLVAKIKTVQNSNDDAKKKQLQESIIKLTNDITFTNEVKALFSDASFPFRGRFDGNDKTIDFAAGAKIKEFNGDDNSKAFSLFGYNEGEINKLNVVNPKFDTNDADKNYVSGIAHVNNGKIINCTVKFDDLNLTSNKAVAFGGIAYLSLKNSNTTTSISDCSVTATVGLTAKSVVFGGIVAKNHGSAITGDSTEIKIKNLDNVNESIIGGIAGENEGQIEKVKNKFELVVNSPTANLGSDNTYIGGGVGINSGEIKTVSSDTTVRVDNSDGFKMGGFIGENRNIVLGVDLKLTVTNINSKNEIYFGAVNYSTYKKFTDKDATVSSVFLHGNVNIKLAENATKLRFSYFAARRDSINDNDNMLKYGRAGYRKFLIDLKTEIESKKGAEYDTSRLELGLDWYEDFKDDTSLASNIALICTAGTGDNKFGFIKVNGEDYFAKDSKGANLKDVKVNDHNLFSSNAKKTNDNLYFQNNEPGKELNNNPLTRDKSIWDIPKFYGTPGPDTGYPKLKDLA